MGERGWSQLRAGYWKLMLLPGKQTPGMQRHGH